MNLPDTSSIIPVRYSADDIELVRMAAAFAKTAHEGQLRKWTYEPYFMHCHRVANTIMLLPYHTADMIAAAYLHDTVEDTETGLGDILGLFGEDVHYLVSRLTKTKQGNRRQTEAVYNLQLRESKPEVQTIKLADILDNVTDLHKLCPEFAPTYLREKMECLVDLQDGDKDLHQIVCLALHDSLEQLRAAA